MSMVGTFSYEMSPFLIQKLLWLSHLLGCLSIETTKAGKAAAPRCCAEISFDVDIQRIVVIVVLLCIWRLGHQQTIFPILIMAKVVITLIVVRAAMFVARGKSFCKLPKVSKSVLSSKKTQV